MQNTTQYFCWLAKLAGCISFIARDIYSSAQEGQGMQHQHYNGVVMQH